MPESKAEKFERLQEARLAKVLEAMRILGRLSNARDYDYTPDQAAAIIDQLRRATDVLSQDFGLNLATASTIAPKDDADEGDAAQEPISARPTSDDPDPSGPKSRVHAHEGAKLKVAPGEWKHVDLLRVGPNLGLAFEAVMDGKNEEALEFLKKVLTA